MVALITGATGIAGATAEIARSHGATVFTVDLAGPADLVGDLTDSSVAGEAVRRCVERHGRLDAVLACAGSSGRRWGDGPVHLCPDEAWQRTIDANLGVAFHTCRAALRQMLGQDAVDGRRGAIVTVGSVLATSPESTMFATHAYTAAKGGLLLMTRAMASYYAPHGIRVNHLAPGLVRTPMTARAQADPDVMAFAAAKQRLTSGMLEAEQVARAAWFLLSADADAVTGAQLLVDGGWSIS